MRTGLRLALLAPVAALALAACSSTSSDTGAPSGQGNANTALTKSGGLLGKPVAVSSLSGSTIGGGSASTAAWKGSVVVVNFYASWCAPCQAETPLLEKAATTHPTVRFLGVLSNDSAANGAAFRRTYGVTYPSLLDTTGGDVAKFRRISPAGLPVTFVLNKQGEVAARYVGGISDAADFDAVLTQLQTEA